MSSLFRAAAAAAESLLNAADESAASVLSTPQKTQQQKHNEQDSWLNSNPALAQTPPALLSLNDATAHAATPQSDVPLSSPAAALNPLQFRADPGKGALIHVPAADDIDFEAILRAEETPPASAKKQQQPKSALQSPAPSSLPTSSRAQTAKTSLLDQLSGGRDIVELLGENELLRGELLSLRASSDASSKKLTAKLSAAQVQLDELQARHEATLARAVDEAAATEGRLSARVRDLEAANLQATRLAAAAQAAASAAELQVSVQKDSLIRLQSSLDDVSQQLDDARDAARSAAADADARAAAERERFLKTIAGLREAEAAATRDREQLSAAAVDANKKSAAAASLAAELRDRANMADSAAAAAAVEAAAARLESEGLRQSAAEAAAAAAATSAAARDERSKLESRIAALQQQVAPETFSSAACSLHQNLRLLYFIAACPSSCFGSSCHSTSTEQPPLQSSCGIPCLLLLLLSLPGSSI
jgi:hypothetical protein